MLRVKQFVALANLTALEAVRRPISLILTTTCVVLIGVTPLLVMHTFGEDGKLVRDGGFAFHFVFGLFVTGYAASSTLAREMRSGTALAVLSKPVSRDVFLLAKFAGVVIVVLAFSACATIATLVAERVAEKFTFTPGLTGYITDHQAGILLVSAPFVAFAFAALLNYSLRRPFESTAFGLLLVCLLLVVLVSGCFDRTGQPAPLDFRLQWRFLPVSLLITLALVVLAALTISLSTRVATVATLTICTGVFLAGLMSDYLFGRFADHSSVAAVLYALIPNWQHFWVVDALGDGGRVPWTYVGRAGLYTVLYAGAMLCIGTASFRHTEMK